MGRSVGTGRPDRVGAAGSVGRDWVGSGRRGLPGSELSGAGSVGRVYFTEYDSKRDLRIDFDVNGNRTATYNRIYTGAAACSLRRLHRPAPPPVPIRPCRTQGSWCEIHISQCDV